MPSCHGLSTPTLCLQLPHTLPSLRPKAGLASLCVQRGHPLPVPLLAASPLCPWEWPWELSAPTQSLQAPAPF